MVLRAVQGLRVFFSLLCEVLLGHKGRRDKMLQNDGYFLSWRLAVETNNVRPWRTAPLCYSHHLEIYMLRGQYHLDVKLIGEQISVYVSEITPLPGDGMDAWVLDVDDTCISNVSYYKGRRFGCDPFDSTGFKAWMAKGACPAIPAVLALFKKLVHGGFKVFLLTGRDEERFGKITIDNLHTQGFIGYERLIMRTSAQKGVSAMSYKSNIRKQLEGEGYRIWGNVGDQWSDLQGDSCGKRTFKLPNPMYCIA